MTLYPYAFLYNDTIVSNRHTAKFSNDLLQQAVLAKAPGLQPKHFAPHFDFRLTDIESHFSKRDDVIFNIVSSTRKLRRSGSRQLVCKNGKRVSLISCIVDLFTLSKGSVLDKYASTMPAPIVALAKIQTCVSIKRDETCFHVDLGWATHWPKFVQKAGDNWTKSQLWISKRLCARWVLLMMFVAKAVAKLLI